MQEDQPPTPLTLSQSKLDVIERSRENFHDFRKFLKARSLVQDKSAKHKQEAAIVAAATAAYAASTSTTSKAPPTPVPTLPFHPHADAQSKTSLPRPLPLTPDIIPQTTSTSTSTSTTSTDFQPQEEKKRKQDTNDQRWNTLLQERKQDRTQVPSIVDHNSLSMLLHESAMDDVHKKIAAVSSARRASLMANGINLTPVAAVASSLHVVDWVLRLHIAQAIGLRRNEDDSSSLGDPFAIVKLNNQEIAHTLTLEDELNPSWDFFKDIHINIKDLYPLTKWSQCVLEVEIYDANASNNHDFLGCVVFKGKDLDQLFNSKQKVYQLQFRGLGLHQNRDHHVKGSIILDFKLIEQKKKHSNEKDEVASDSDEEDDADITRPASYGDAALKDQSLSDYELTPRSSLLNKRSASFRVMGSSRRTSIELLKTRRKASAMSLKEMMDGNDGDVSLSWLMSVPMFADLTPPEINALRDALVPQEFEDGNIIILEGDLNAKTFYIIQTGNVSVLKTIDGVEKLVNTMTPGQTFGERALLIEGEARAATCQASGKVTCLVLGRETFANMLGSSTTLIDENYKPGRGNDPDAAGLTRHVERFSELIKWFALATEEGNRDTILEAGLCLELHKLFSPELRPKDILERTISTMYSLFDAERVGLFLIDHENKSMVLAVSPDARYLKLPLCGIAGHVATTGEFENVKDCYSDPRFNQSLDKQSGFRTQSMVSCPLKNKLGEVVAVIQLINKKGGQLFDTAGIADHDDGIENENGNKNEHGIKPISTETTESMDAKSSRAVMTASRFRRKGSLYKNQISNQIGGLNVEETKSKTPRTKGRRNSFLLASINKFKEKDGTPVKANRSGRTASGAKGRGGRVIRGRTLDDARKRKKEEMDNKPVPWPTFTKDDAKLLKQIALQLEPVISEARAQKNNKSKKNFKNLRKLDYSLLVNVESCANMRKFVRTGPKDKETGLRTGPLLVRPIPKGKKMEVTLALYHGEKMLHDRCTTSSATLDNDGNVTWDEELIHSCTLSCLPRATRFIFIVHKPGKGPNGTNKPVGWSGMSAMDFRDALVSGKHRLRLWPGACLSPTVPILQPVQDEKAAGFLHLVFPSFGQEVRYYEVDDEELGDICFETGRPKSATSRRRSKQLRGDSTRRFSVDLSKSMLHPTQLSDRLHRIIYQTALTELSEEEQSLVWQARDQLTQIPNALPKVLLSVKWDQPDIVSEMHTLLYMWKRMEPLQALSLLDSRFPDPKVRAYAVQLLDELGDDELRPFLLQLVQCLKHEAYHDSALSRFLICRAIQNADHIGHILYWLLKSEVHIDVVRDRFSLILAEYLRAVEPEIRTELGHQGFVMRRLVAIANDVGACEGGKAARKKLLHERLRATALPATFQLPLSPDVICDGIRIEECRVMDSKKKPLWLVFDAIEWKEMHNNDAAGNHAPGHFKFPVLFKAGDDLRQDQLTLQLLSIMDNLWKGAGMDLQLSPYACVATGDQIGFLEVVQHSTTLASVVKNNTSLSRGKKGIMAKFSAAKKAVYNKDYIKVWLEAEARESLATGIVHNPLLLSDRQRQRTDVANKPEKDPVKNLKEFNKRFMLS